MKIGRNPLDCFLLVPFFSRRSRRLRRPEKIHQINGQSRTPVPTRVRYPPCLLSFASFLSSVGVDVLGDPRATIGRLYEKRKQKKKQRGYFIPSVEGSRKASGRRGR